MVDVQSAKGEPYDLEGIALGVHLLFCQITLSYNLELRIAITFYIEYHFFTN